MPALEEFDLIVIGAGPGGYVAALRASELGMRTVCIEKEPNPGGVCLNVGCIPSKALLESTEFFYLSRNHFEEHGIGIGEARMDLARMMDRKRRVVSGLVDGVRKLLEGNKVVLLRGTARLVPDGSVEVHGADGGVRLLKAGAVLLATGSEPVSLPFLPFNGESVVSSTEALEFDTVPGRLGIVGGGYIGLELGSVWSRLGSRVTVIEVLPAIAAGLDRQAGRLLERTLKRQGLRFLLETKVIRAEIAGNEVTLTLQSADKEDSEVFDKVLVAVGRKPLTKGLGLEELGIQLDGRGFIVVDEKYRTSNPRFYAIGDTIPGPMLAHKASAEGIAAVECIAGLPGYVDYDAIPAVVYTSPEVASVGKTEQELKELGTDYRAGVYPFSGVARARCLGQTEGLVKILSQARSDRILGVHIIGPHASELIAECVLAMRFHMKSEDLARTIHAHPTLSEGIHEAALALGKSPGR